MDRPVFIKLTKLDDRKVLLNIFDIIAVEDIQYEVELEASYETREGTKVTLTQSNYIMVQESTENVEKILKGALTVV